MYSYIIFGLTFLFCRIILRRIIRKERLELPGIAELVFYFNFINCKFVVINQPINTIIYNILGPSGLPLIGNLLQIGTKPHLTLTKWATKFGSLYKIRVAHKHVIVANDAKVARELFGLNEATGRFQTELFTNLVGGKYGIGNAEGTAWQEQRLFCLYTLKTLGFNQSHRMEPIINGEADNLCKTIAEQHLVDREVILKKYLKHATTNVLWTMITGESTQESTIVQLMDDWVQCVQQATSHGLVFFPWLKHFPIAGKVYKKFINVGNLFRSYVEIKFDQHASVGNFMGPPQNLVDAYIKEIKSCSDPNSSFYRSIGKNHAMGSICAMMLAGGETVGTVLHWVIFYLIAHPKCQERLHLEIDNALQEGQQLNLHAARK